MATQHNLPDFPAVVRGKRPIFRFWQEYNRDQKLFIVESMFINSANVITGGVFLTGLLVMMGATNLTVGLVISSATWSLMLSLLSSVIVERARRRKALMTYSLVAFRLLTTLPVFLPALMGRGLPTATAAAAMMIVGNASFSLFNTGFPVFFMDSIPKEGRIAYIYSRMLFLRIAYTVASVAMGLLLDFLNKSYAGFVIVYVFGIVLGAADIASFTMIRGQGGTRDDRPDVAGLTRRLFEPFRNKGYLRFLVFTFVYFLFLTTASSYTALYQVKYLHLSYAFLTVYNTCIYVLMIAVTRRWAAAEAAAGSFRVLVICSLLLPMDLIVYSFLTTGTLWLVAFSVLFSGIGSSGLWACILPYRYSLMPDEGRTVYEGWYGFIYGAANLLGALAGGNLQSLLPEVRVGSLAFSNFQIIYFIAGLSALAVTAVFWSRARKDAPESA